MKITDPNEIVVLLDGVPIEGRETRNAVLAIVLAAQLVARCELTYDGTTATAEDVNPSALAHVLASMPADAANIIRVAAALASTRASRARRAEKAA